MKQPEGVACSEKSLLIVGDTGNDRLLRYSYQDRSLKAGTEIKIPQLSNPIRVQINSKEEIFALDGKKRRIIRLNPDGTFKGYVDGEYRIGTPDEEKREGEIGGQKPSDSESVKGVE